VALRLGVRDFIIITSERGSFWSFPWIPDPVKDRSGMTKEIDYDYRFAEHEHEHDFSL
jgi:hypothetical protein